MNTRQAATCLGLSIQQVRWLIRTSRLKANKVKTRPGQTNQHGFEYSVSKQEVDRVRNLPFDKVGRRTHGGKHKKRGGQTGANKG